MIEAMTEAELYAPVSDDAIAHCALQQKEK